MKIQIECVQKTGKTLKQGHSVSVANGLYAGNQLQSLKSKGPWITGRSRYFQGHVSLTQILITILHNSRTSRVRISCCVSSALVEHCVLKPSRISAETSIIDCIVSIVWIASRALFISYSLSASITVITVSYTVH